MSSDGRRQTTPPADDFTQINGIGPARSRWLQQNFSIRTFRELANLPADTILQRMKQEGKPASQSEIEAWLAEARALATTPTPTSQMLAEFSLIVELVSGAAQPHIKIRLVDSQTQMTRAAIQTEIVTQLAPAATPKPAPAEPKQPAQPAPKPNYSQYFSNETNSILDKLNRLTGGDEGSSRV